MKKNYTGLRLVDHLYNSAMKPPDVVINILDFVEKKNYLCFLLINMNIIRKDV